MDDLPFQPQDLEPVFSTFRVGVEGKGIPIRDPLRPLKKGDAPALALADRALLAAKAAGAGPAASTAASTATSPPPPPPTPPLPPAYTGREEADAVADTEADAAEDEVYDPKGLAM